MRYYNRTRARAERLQSLGARIADTPGMAASGAEAVITMLADDRAVEDTVFAEENPGHGVLDGLPEKAIHISMSTISVQIARRLEKAHRNRRQHFISAPVGLMPPPRQSCLQASSYPLHSEVQARLAYQPVKGIWATARYDICHINLVMIGADEWAAPRLLSRRRFHGARVPVLLEKSKKDSVIRVCASWHNKSLKKQVFRQLYFCYIFKSV